MQRKTAVWVERCAARCAADAAGRKDRRLSWWVWTWRCRHDGTWPTETRRVWGICLPARRCTRRPITPPLRRTRRQLPVCRRPPTFRHLQIKRHISISQCITAQLGQPTEPSQADPASFLGEETDWKSSKTEASHGSCFPQKFLKNYLNGYLRFKIVGSFGNLKDKFSTKSFSFFTASFSTVIARNWATAYNWQFNG